MMVIRKDKYQLILLRMNWDYLDYLATDVEGYISF